MTQQPPLSPAADASARDVGAARNATGQALVPFRTSGHGKGDAPRCAGCRGCAGDELGDLVRMASHLFACPIAMIAAAEAENFRLLAECGFGKTLVARKHAICRAIDHDTPLLMVPDAANDARFCDDPAVQCANGVRFYLGIGLFGSTGLLLGVLSVADFKPRSAVSGGKLAMLHRLARLAARLIERRAAERSQGAAQDPASNAFSAVVMVDAVGAVLSANDAAQALFGGTLECGQSMQALFPPALQDEPESTSAWLCADSGEARDVAADSRELRMLSPNHELRTLEAVRCAWRHGETGALAVILRDVTARHRLRAARGPLAEQDPLIDAPYRAALLEMLAGQLAQGRPLVVAPLGLDNFRVLNDTLGSSLGDTVLQIIACRLLARLPANAHLARYDGDEFAVVFPDAAADEVDSGLQTVLRDIARPCDVDHHRVHVEASIGVTRYDIAPDATGLPPPVDAGELLALAGLAMREARRAGGQRLRWFEPGMRTEAIDRRKLDLELRRACMEGEFELHYQPQIDLASGCPTGAEALLRWRHPERGLLFPGVFIDALSHSVVAPAVGRWIIQRACLDAAAWPRSGGRRLAVGVNLFPVQLDDGQLLDEVDRALAQAGLDPSLLELELTETTALRNDGVVEELLAQLRARGVRVSFDDFGTGYASLSMLHRLPVHRIKIDRSFVHNVTGNRGNEAIVRSIVLMARTFDMQVIAEGVETASQAAFLHDIACDEVQGFLYSKALAPDDFHRWLDQHVGVPTQGQAHG